MTTSVPTLSSDEEGHLIEGKGRKVPDPPRSVSSPGPDRSLRSETGLKTRGFRRTYMVPD